MKIRDFIGYDLMDQVKLIVSKYLGRRVKSYQIFCLDSSAYSNGLADRLRGIMSVYAYSKCIGREFKIYHKEPFMLSTYFSPNKYNWEIHFDDICHIYPFASPVIMLDKFKPIRLNSLCKYFQHHFYTNEDWLPFLNKKYSMDFKPHVLFEELFRPSFYFMEQINKYSLSDKYISASFRFMQLLGDFKDIRGETLNELDQKKLMEKCLQKLKELHEVNSNYKILVTADSEKFIKYVSSESYVYTIPGPISHIGHHQAKSQIDLDLKTFLDFYFIGKAEKVYMLHSGKMYRSNFARSAALYYNRPYNEISF